jgi:GNAT superfamily N-acetyltransferase
MNQFKVIAFDKHQQRGQFDCGINELNNYVCKQIGQDFKRNIATPFVLLDENKIIGFYTLSASAVDVNDLPVEITRKLPKYASIPVALLGRLAVDKNYQKQGLGGLLLMDALKRSLHLSKEIALMALIVDAKDQTAINFYEQYNFKKLKDKRLFLPIQTIETALTK